MTNSITTEPAINAGWAKATKEFLEFLQSGREFVMPNCKTCKWWEEEPDGGWGGDDWRDCNHKKLNGNQRGSDVCVPIGWEGANIVTGPDFGCIHWEGKA